MNQQEFDFNKDINKPAYTAEDNLRINEIVSNYQDKKNTINDEAIIIKLFFEEDCIEISKRLILIGFFEGGWTLVENSFGKAFHEFILNQKRLHNYTLSEFIFLFLSSLNCSIKTIDFQNNSKNEFSFDRKITESILNNISEGNTYNAVLLYIVYTKIWNQFEIYTKPFNNHKGQLIHEIFSKRIWPKDIISYKAYSEFEKSVNHIFTVISNKDIYMPFFDKKKSITYSNLYLKYRNKLTENIEKLFDYDLTDESEPYYSLIIDIIYSPQENEYKKELIRSKVEKHMLPSFDDIKMFEKLYNYSTEKEFGKWLLSKFYLYSKIDY